MLSRRDALLGGVAYTFELLRRRASASAAASQPSTRVAFDVPSGACDCHTHIFGNAQQFPFAPTRVYTPEPALVEEMRGLHRALHMDRVVIVQPSVYGTDNACTLDAIRQLGPRARGVAVIDDNTPDRALDDMHRGGIRGVRLNLATAGVTDPDVGRRRFTRTAERLKARGWHIQMNTDLSMIEALRPQVATSDVPVVFDHFGGARAALGTRQPGFDALLDLVRSGKAYVKISGAYRASTQPPDYQDAAPLATALIAANVQRILWGTDWPHPDAAHVVGRRPTDIAPLLQIDDGRVLNQLAVWAPDPARRKTILVDNAARLYRF
jgi:predicted TIM-barrel fold metal-dependent hydrolase